MEKEKNMIESAVIASVLVLMKIFHDREIIFYQSKWEYVLIWFGAFSLSYSASLMAGMFRDVLK
jgi:hypothetical protein